MSEADYRGLAELLIDTVESGAAVSFVLPFPLEQAERWWRKAVAESTARSIFLIARDEHGIAGTVQVHPAWAPNGPHRGELVKLMVHRRARGHGLAGRLLQRLEELARENGYRLLTLDTRRGDVAEQLYRSHGWIAAGTIPRYALDPDRAALHDAVIYYKELD